MLSATKARERKANSIKKKKARAKTRRGRSGLKE
jgi:hypothetical protein